MDTGYTYSTAHRVVAKIYVSLPFDPPDEITMTLDGHPERFVRLSDRSLACGAVQGVPGECRSTDCHTTALGECQCGRHAAPVRFERAV